MDTLTQLNTAIELYEEALSILDNAAEEMEALNPQTQLEGELEQVEQQLQVT